jgi:hypothetical protein
MVMKTMTARIAGRSYRLSRVIDHRVKGRKGNHVEYAYLLTITELSIYRQ